MENSHQYLVGNVLQDVRTKKILARAPNIFVIGMSRRKDRTAVDVLHLEDEVAKRKDRERMNTIDLETWTHSCRLRSTSSTGSREDELLELKHFQEQLKKRSADHQRIPRRFRPPQRRALPAVGGDKNDVNHHEEMQDTEAPVLIRRTLIQLNMKSMKPNKLNHVCYHHLVEVRRPSGSWVAPIDTVRAAVAGKPEFGMISGTWNVHHVLNTGPWVEIFYAPAPGEQPEEGKHYKCFEDRRWLPDKLVPAEGRCYCLSNEDVRIGTAGSSWIAIKGTNGAESIEEEVLPPLEMEIVD